MLEIVQPYTTALLSLTILVLVVCVQSLISTYVNLLKGGGTPGKIVEGDHEASSWRLYRVHQNSLENFSPFAVTVIVGILVGGSAGWINTLAVIHFIARVAHWIIYSKGIGPVAAGPRTISFVIAFTCNLLMALVVLIALI